MGRTAARGRRGGLHELVGDAAPVRHPAGAAPGHPRCHPRRSRGPWCRDSRSFPGGLGCAPPGGGKRDCGCSRPNASGRSSSSLFGGVSRREIRCPRRPRSRCRSSCHARGRCWSQRSLGKARGILKGRCAACRGTPFGPFALVVRDAGGTGAVFWLGIHDLGPKTEQKDTRCKTRTGKMPCCNTAGLLSAVFLLPKGPRSSIPSQKAQGKPFAEIMTRKPSLLC